MIPSQKYQNRIKNKKIFLNNKKLPKQFKIQTQRKLNKKSNYKISQVKILNNSSQPNKFKFRVKIPVRTKFYLNPF